MAPVPSDGVLVPVVVVVQAKVGTGDILCSCLRSEQRGGFIKKAWEGGELS